MKSLPVIRILKLFFYFPRPELTAVLKGELFGKRSRETAHIRQVRMHIIPVMTVE